MRNQLVNKFFEQLVDEIRNGEEISYDLVYGWLAGYGCYIEGNMSPKNVSDKFLSWKTAFAKVANINVEDSKVSSFCLFFSSTKGNLSDSLKKIKLYVPVSAENVDDVVKRIFAFLAGENIRHSSKVRNVEGSDSIVIRLYNSEDANRLISFCQSDERIKSSLISVNPFVISDNGIGITWDAMLSYNETVAFWIADYLDFCRNNGMLDSVSCQNFVSHVEKRVNEIFKLGDGVDSFLTSKYHSNEYGFLGHTGLKYFYLGECEEAFLCLTELLVGSLKSEQVGKEYVYNSIPSFGKRIEARGSKFYHANNISMSVTPEQREAFEIFLLLLYKMNLFKVSLGYECDAEIYDDVEGVNAVELATPDKRRELHEAFDEKVKGQTLWDILGNINDDIYRYSNFGLYLFGVDRKINERFFETDKLFDDEINNFLTSSGLTPDMVAYLWDRAKKDELDVICKQIIKSAGPEVAKSILTSACDPIKMIDVLDYCSEFGVELENKSNCMNFQFYGNSLIKLIVSVLKEEQIGDDKDLGGLVLKSDSELCFFSETFDEEAKKYLMDICSAYIDSRSGHGYAK